MLARVVAHLGLHGARVTSVPALGEDEVLEVRRQPGQAFGEAAPALDAPRPRGVLDEGRRRDEAHARRRHTRLRGDALRFEADQVVGDGQAHNSCATPRGLLLRVDSSRASMTRLTSLEPSSISQRSW